MRVYVRVCLCLCVWVMGKTDAVHREMHCPGDFADECCDTHGPKRGGGGRKCKAARRLPVCYSLSP
jgi:hypothetical protein